jgi:hypothetical protein
MVLMYCSLTFGFFSFFEIDQKAIKFSAPGYQKIVKSGHSHPVYSPENSLTI